MFVAIGRLGRSLHIHLLRFAATRGGKLRGLDSHLSYRIGLKTFSANESRSVLVCLTPTICRAFGAGYLKVRFGRTPQVQRLLCVRHLRATPSGAAGPGGSGGSDSVTIVPFSSEPVWAEPTRAEQDSAADAMGRDGTVALDMAQALLDEEPIPDPLDTVPQPIEPPPAVSSPAAASLLETLLRRIEGHGTPAHEVWLPPLDESPTVAQLVGGTPTGTLRLPIGIVDRPADQRRDPLVIDLAGSLGQRGDRGRTTVRQVDRGAHHRAVRRGHAHAGAGAVLLSGLRRRQPRRSCRAAARRVRVRTRRYGWRAPHHRRGRRGGPRT